jgi:DNA-binding MarR family transcriptional regulator
MAKGLSKKLNFGVLVHEVSRMRRKAIDHVVKPLGITGGQWWLLTYISLHNGLSQIGLAEELNMGKVTIGGLLDRLEQNELIERRPDINDRRVKRVFLTQSGIALVEEIRRASASVQDIALNGISSTELECAIEALTKMEANLVEFLKNPKGARPTVDA